jgi:arylsulfatase A-like enzyme
VVRVARLILFDSKGVLAVAIAASTLAAPWLWGCEESPGPQAELSMLAALRGDRIAVGVPASQGFAIDRRPHIKRVTFDGETRTGVVTEAAGWRWRGRIPAKSTLYLGLQRAARESDPPSDPQLRLRLRSGDQEESLSRPLDIGVILQRWNDFAFDLEPYSGAEIEIAASVVGSDGGEPDLSIAWSPVIIGAGRPRPADERPSVILVLIDTLRADHLSSYGYGRPTSPEIDRRLARQGVLFERAYAQAPWTMPSVASLHSGLPPAQIRSAERPAYKLPSSGPVLAERFSTLGYDTAAFIANPLVHAGIGYDRGFDTFYAPQTLGSINSSTSNASALHQRIEPWLRAHRERPFFLYVHYLDPHSPYDNPDISEGRSRFYPDYQGRLRGRDVFGLALGKLSLDDPPTDVAHLTALYDSEISYVDRHVGRLLELAEERGERDLLVALTSDHGEELYDHRGWEHAVTLYNELLRVPLILRFPDRQQRGERVAGQVALLDLAPTLLAAAGGELPQVWSGLDLRGSSSGDRDSPPRPIFAERMELYDPLRVAVFAGDRKLILFDRRGAESLPTRNERQRLVQEQALRRFAARERYDLARDPKEQINLAGRDGGGDLEAMIHRYVDSYLAGLRIAARGLEPGTILEAEIELERPPERWRSLFLQSGDRVEMAGQRVRLRFEGDGWIKGVLLEGEQLGVRSIRILDASTATARIVVGTGTDYGGGPKTAAALRTERWPLDVEGPALGVWLRAATRHQMAHPEVDEETARRLRSLGYAD